MKKLSLLQSVSDEEKMVFGADQTETIYEYNENVKFQGTKVHTINQQ